MRSSNQCRIGSPSLRSGVAVSPSSSDGRRLVEDPLVGGRSGVVELVDDHDVEVLGVKRARPFALRLWIEAKTWSKSRRP